MEVCKRLPFLLFIINCFFICVLTWRYDISKHPCCFDTNADNFSMAMVIDPFEIYGHDPTDKLDHYAHYQNELLKVKKAPDQFVINELVHIATDHLEKFIQLHIKELKVLLIAMDDTVDNIVTMHGLHQEIISERIASATSGGGGPVPSEFYMSQEYYCGKNVYIFISELYSDILNMGKGPQPYCGGPSFHFIGFVHYLNEQRYFVEDNPSVAFEMNNYAHGLECHMDLCIFRFPPKKIVQSPRDIVLLPKAEVKCGLVTYKLPPVQAVSCIVNSGSFILDFNIQGLRYRHHDFVLTVPNGDVYYTKEVNSPLICEHHFCEWNYTNFFGGPFTTPDDDNPVLPPHVDPHTESPPTAVTPTSPTWVPNDTFVHKDCLFTYPPNFGSIAGISYIDPLIMHGSRYTCKPNDKTFQGLYWYPQWMGAPPYHPYPVKNVPNPGPYHPLSPLKPILSKVLH